MPDVASIRKYFPALHQQVYGKQLIYLDNAATTQKPQQVIDRVVQYYSRENSNIHRGVHYLSQKATAAYESARDYTATFINARHSHEIIFTRGTTESINLLASSLGTLLMQQGDKVLVTAMEHHSNLVPWQQLCLRHKGELLVARFDETGTTDLNHYAELLAMKPKIVAITHISNALGTINPIHEMIRMAHAINAPVLVDGAQSIAHSAIDVRQLDCDFFAFSAHKAYGPMGAGVLYGKTDWLEKMPPYHFGGEMVDKVSFNETTFNKLPFKFEAGTPNVEAVLGMETALRFIEDIGYQHVAEYEAALLEYATAQMMKIDGMRIFGNASHKAAVISFLVHNIHPYDMGILLDKLGIAVRTGHHCAQPVMDCFEIPGTVRASFAVYNTFQEIDIFVAALKKASAMLA